MSLDPELKSYLERLARGIEALAEDPMLQMEARLPHCPYCKTMNPSVRTQDVGGEGRIGEFIVQAHCTVCNEVFYGLPFQWDCVRSPEEAKAVISERSSMNVGNHSGTN